MLNTLITKDFVESAVFSNDTLSDFDRTKYEYVGTTIGTVCLDYVKGTEHGSYSGKTWGELCPIEERLTSHQSMKRGNRNLVELKENPQYYFSHEEKDHWEFAFFEGNYYIIVGNHRTVLARYFLELNRLPSEIHNVPISTYRRSNNKVSALDPDLFPEDKKEGISQKIKNNIFGIILIALIIYLLS